MKKSLILALLAISLNAQNQKMQVYKPVTSTCPKSWIDEMKKEVDNFEMVSLMDVKNLKKSIGIPKNLYSCNTSILDDYVFEGNVPSAAIKDFFANIQNGAIGLALPANQNDKEIKIVYIMYEDNSYKEFGKYR